MAVADEQTMSLAPDQLVLIHPTDTFEDEPLRRHLLSGRIEAVDTHGLRLRPFAGDADSFQDYDSFVPWTSVGLATVITPAELPRMRQVLNDNIRRALAEVAELAADRDRAVGRL